MKLYAQANTSSAASDLLQLLRNIKTLQADFIQENYDAKKNLLQTQNGNFKVMESGEFIWNTATPYEQKIISDGKLLKIFDPDLEQLTIKPMDKKAQVIPLLLFSGGEETIAEQYDISSSGKDRFELRAKDKNSLFEKLEVSFKKGIPLSLTIIDSMKQKTLVRFENASVNKAF
jgi:outer membrane lipoprotein carrier protein